MSQTFNRFLGYENNAFVNDGTFDLSVNSITITSLSPSQGVSTSPASTLVSGTKPSYASVLANTSPPIRAGSPPTSVLLTRGITTSDKLFYQLQLQFKLKRQEHIT